MRWCILAAVHPIEALRFLGLEEGAGASTVRRAYLRKLKDHKPDRDPEGFKRLREAYEAAADAVARPEEPVPEDFRGRDREDFAEAEDDFPLAPYLERMDGVPDGETDAGDRQNEIAREALRDHPELEDALLLLASAQRFFGREEDAVETLRRGLEAGHARCLHALATWRPERLSARQEERWRDGAEPIEMLEVADVRLAREDVEQGMSLVRQALERHDPITPGPPLAPPLALLALRLHACCRPELAREVTEQIEAQLELRPLEPDSAVRFSVQLTLSQELDALPLDFPASLRRAMAVGILEGRMVDAGDAMHEYAMAHPGIAPDVAEHLEATPTLHHFYHHLLSGPESTSYAGKQMALPAGSVLAIALVFIAIRSGDDSRHDVRLPAELEGKSVTEMVTVLETPFNPVTPVPAQLAADCALVESEPSACALVEDLTRSLSSHRCAQALDVVAELAALAPQTASDDAPAPDDVPTVEPPAAQADRDVLARIARTAEDSWSSRCALLAHVAEGGRLATEMPALVGLCQAPSGIEAIRFCFDGRRAAQALESRRCAEAGGALEELNRRRTTDDPQDPSYQALAELYAVFDARCRDGA